MKTLKDQVAVITGAGSGIGRGIAQALAEAGSHIVVADVNAVAAEHVAAELHDSQGGKVRTLAVACDVSQADAVERLADQAYKAFGVVNILCNNAGVSWRPYRSLLDATLEDMQFIWGVNYWGVVHGLKTFVPRMRQQSGDKHIVNTASIGSMLPLSGHVAYGSSKAAVAYLSETTAEELAPQGFGFTILCPGVVKTDLANNSLRLRNEGGAAQKRVFEPLATPMMDRVATLGTFTPEAVGRMVANAILDNTLYLHTSIVPGDLVAQRTHIQFGPQTVGRV